MSHSVRQAVLVSLFTALVLSGCSNDTSNDTPTVAEAGETLKAHITEVLRQVEAHDIVVTASGEKDIPCGKGRAKRIYSAQGKDSWEKRDSAIMNTIMFAKLVDIAPYSLAGGHGARFIRVSNADLGVTITLHSSKNGQYAIAGETYCLPIARN